MCNLRPENTRGYMNLCMLTLVFFSLELSTALAYSYSVPTEWTEKVENSIHFSVEPIGITVRRLLMCRFLGTSPREIILCYYFVIQVEK